MPILLYGMNHLSAPLKVRERVAFPPEALGGAVERLLGCEPIREGLILSTCNRTEILVHVEHLDAGEALRQFLQNERDIQDEDLERHCYLHADGEAVRHIFRVASSLDSMVLGEAQILGQVKEAYARAQQAGGLRTVLDTLMQRSFSVAKRVRTETGVARYPVSIAHAAVGLARDIFGDLKNSAILIVGAGKMARLAARHLIGSGVKSVVVVNRSYQRAVDMARELGGRAAPFDRLFEEMQRADVVLTSTASPEPVVSRDDGERLGRQRRGRPLFFIDIAVPRDVDPRVNEVDNVYLYDIDDLQGVVRRNLEERRHEAVQAESIVEHETDAYLAWLRTLQAAPMIVDLRNHIHGIGASELQRFRGRLGDLAPGQEQVLQEFTTALLNKVLHHPIRALKQAARNGGGPSIEFLKEIFGLGRSATHPEDRPERLPAGEQDEEPVTPRRSSADAGREER